jgi:hypothetical protein
MIEYSKLLRLEPGGQEVIACTGNYDICQAAFDKALFVYPTQHLELRQGARVICKSKEDRTSAIYLAALLCRRMWGRVIQSSGPVRYAMVDGLNVRDSRVHNYPPRWNAAPSQELLVIRCNHKTGEVSLDPLRRS